jgi:hypothetical protein
MTQKRTSDAERSAKTARALAEGLRPSREQLEAVLHTGDKAPSTAEYADNLSVILATGLHKGSPIHSELVRIRKLLEEIKEKLT